MQDNILSHIVFEQDLETPFGIWHVTASQVQAGYLYMAMAAISGTDKGFKLLRRAHADGVTISCDALMKPNQGGLYHPPTRIVKINPDMTIAAQARTLVHECAHHEQETLGFRTNPQAVSLIDYFMERRISEAAAFALGLEAAWDISKALPLSWGMTHIGTPLLSLKADFSMAGGDRQQARNAVFLGFLEDLIREQYDARFIEGMENLELLTTFDIANMPFHARRSPEEYRKILASHGFVDIPGFNPEDPLWCGMSEQNRKRLEACVTEKCRGVPPPAGSLPPVHTRTFCASDLAHTLGAGLSIARNQAPVLAPLTNLFL